MTFFMSDNIFISWSKSKSREFAFEVKNLLETLNPHLNIFMSEDNISAGEKVQEKIIQKISECDKVLLCFTRDNKKSPWLLYEAGYACGQNKMVIPLLFDEDPNWHSWIDNPMNIAREININSISFEESFINCFNLCDFNIFRGFCTWEVGGKKKILMGAVCRNNIFCPAYADYFGSIPCVSR